MNRRGTYPKGPFMGLRGKAKRELWDSPAMVEALLGGLGTTLLLLLGLLLKRLHDLDVQARQAHRRQRGLSCRCANAER